VYCVIAANPGKKYAVSPEQRKELLEKMLVEGGVGENCQVAVTTDYVWRFAKSVRAKVCALVIIIIIIIIINCFYESRIIIIIIDCWKIIDRTYRFSVTFGS
jgi:hypothetical protein